MRWSLAWPGAVRHVADRLNVPLDVTVARKLARILNKRIIDELGLTDEGVENVVARAQAEMRRREELYRGGQAAALHGQTAILVDDGLATGSTMMAAIRHTRALAEFFQPVSLHVVAARLLGHFPE